MPEAIWPIIERDGAVLAVKVGIDGRRRWAIYSPAGVEFRLGEVKSIILEVLMEHGRRTAAELRLGVWGSGALDADSNLLPTHVYELRRIIGVEAIRSKVGGPDPSASWYEFNAAGMVDRPGTSHHTGKDSDARALALP